MVVDAVFAVLVIALTLWWSHLGRFRRRTRSAIAEHLACEEQVMVGQFLFAATLARMTIALVGWLW